MDGDNLRMGIGGTQSQMQRQALNLTMKMRASLRLLEMAAPELRAELAREMVANPAIEDIRYGDRAEPLSAVAPDEHNADSPADRELNFDDTPDRAEAILSADDGYRDRFLSGLENASGDEEEDSRRTRFLDSRLKRPRSLQEHLLAQLPVSGLPERDMPLARVLVGNIDSSGYFRGSVPDIVMIHGVAAEHVDEVLAVLKRLDPPGCGSKTPREYLLGRLAEIPQSARADVRAMLNGPLFDPVGENESPAARIEKAKRLSGMTPERFAAALAALRKLDPSPAAGFDDGGETPQEISPDIFVTVGPDGEPAVRVNSREIPEIRFSERFKALARRKDATREEREYVRNRINAAISLVEAVENRADTVLRVAQCIVDGQKEFFKTGDKTKLRPLSRLAVAAKTGLHESTVSRTVKGKYASTPWGLFEMRMFFPAGLPADGGGGMSSGAVKEMIRRAIDSENKAHPLSDLAISGILKEKGVHIARRTVAKYRVSMKIPGAAERILSDSSS